MRLPPVVPRRRRRELRPSDSPCPSCPAGISRQQSQRLDVGCRSLRRTGCLPLLLWPAVPGAVALAFGVAWVAAYFLYEWIHAADHLLPPRNADGRWTRRSHFHHHYKAPLRNFGVTTPIWDLVFGTYDSVSRMAVPRRLAPVWLLDGSGGLKDESAGSYFVRGPPHRPGRRWPGTCPMGRRRPEGGFCPAPRSDLPCPVRRLPAARRPKLPTEPGCWPLPHRYWPRGRRSRSGGATRSGGSPRSCGGTD